MKALLKGLMDELADGALVLKGIGAVCLLSGLAVAGFGIMVAAEAFTAGTGALGALMTGFAACLSGASAGFAGVMAMEAGGGIATCRRNAAGRAYMYCEFPDPAPAAKQALGSQFQAAALMPEERAPDTGGNAAAPAGDATGRKPAKLKL